MGFGAGELLCCGSETLCTRVVRRIVKREAERLCGVRGRGAIMLWIRLQIGSIFSTFVDPDLHR